MAEILDVPERIAEGKVIVYKSQVDPAIVKFTAEKMKSKLFTKFGFSKPRPDEISIVSIDKYYEPYFLINAKYSIEYCRRRLYSFDVDDETEKVRMDGKLLKPETIVESTGESSRVVKLEVDECSSYGDMAYIVLDKSGREVPLDSVPSAPSEDHPHKKLKEARKKVGEIGVSPQNGVEMVKARIVKRPPNVDKIEEELFEIFENTMIYTPIYEVTFRNLKTAQETNIGIDGVTGKIVMPPRTCQYCSKENKSDAEYCEACGKKL